MKSSLPSGVTSPEALARAAAAMPLFPLPRVVLMPGALLPLHIFEPRYQELVRYALAGDRLLAVATLQPGFEERYFDAPSVFALTGIGHILSHQPFDDGRSNLVVQFVARARILAEVPSEHAFRLARVAILQDVDDGGGVIDRLRLLILQIGGSNEAYRAEALRLARLPAFELVDELARKLLDDPELQRRYLDYDRISERAEAVLARMSRSIEAGPMVAGDA